MRIVYLDADFASATDETGQRSSVLSRRLVARGHHVTMLTSDRQFELPPEAGRLWTTRVDDTPVVAANVGLRRRRRGFGWIWQHVLFAAIAGRYLLGCERPDVIYVTSPPLSAVIPVLLARWFRGIPFVLEVREIWPEVPRGVDLIRSRTLVLLLRGLALLGYRAAAGVVAFTEPAVNHIQADIPLARKVTRIGPCCELDRFARGDGAAVRARHGWAGRFVCLHVGPMTRNAGIESILRVADAVREDEQFVFWLVGGGDHRPELERNIRDRELHNVVLQDAVSREELPDVLAAADLCLLTVRHFRVLEQGSGERLFDCLAAGKPVLLNYSGWQRDLLESRGAGLGTPLGQHRQFFDHVCRLCDRPDLRAAMGEQARQIAATEGDPDRCVERLERVLQNAVLATGSRPPEVPPVAG
jgi:glycosyltransferase involved in cell wall biosynthesis